MELILQSTLLNGQVTFHVIIIWLKEIIAESTLGFDSHY